MKITRRTIQTIDIGQFRDIVTMTPPTDVRDGRDVKRVFNPADAQEYYALVHPGGNVRDLQEAQVVYDNAITVYIRWDDVVRENWRLTYAGDDYTVHKSSNVDARNRFMQMLCYSKKL